MKFMDLEMGWFEIAEVPIINQYLARGSQIFNEVWLSRYTRRHKVILDKGYQLNRNLILLLKYFSVKPTCTTIKNPQADSIL